MSNQSNIIEERDKELDKIRRKGEETEVGRRAQKLKLPYLDLSTLPVDRDNINLIVQGDAEKSGVVVIRKDKKDLKVGVTDYQSSEANLILERLKKQGFQLKIYLISQSSFKKAIKEYAKAPLQFAKKEITGQVSLENVSKDIQSIKTFSDFTSFLESPDKKETSEILEILLLSALELGASDIHIEPQEDSIKVRLRLDGVLEEIGSISIQAYKLLLSRVKLVSSIQLNVTDVPQDGRFTIKTNTFEAESRVSILPGAYGEYIVIRILNPNAIQLEVKDLGIREAVWQKIKPEIEKPNGIVLVTGPTGSGKTTTLYAFLKHLLKPAIKIITLEDPIEYHLEGISQSQIEPEKDFGFAKGLRSILRQDPDILLIGEIRDDETAQTALNAALTGHFVFSTLHTNDAIGAIPRFLDLNAKPQILASALNAVIAQRLVRKLCSACKKPIKIGADFLEKIKENIGNDKNLLDVINKTPIIYQAVGCSKCSDTGYKGRIGIFEVLIIDNELEKIIPTSPAHQELMELAIKQGFLSMYNDGILRVFEGITTLEEINRVALALA
jgi:type II secretory ATPase GspE/PulE/Tfp pilus assembly ATPase PilB-like protein